MTLVERLRARSRLWLTDCGLDGGAAGAADARLDQEAADLIEKMGRDMTDLHLAAQARINECEREHMRMPRRMTQEEIDADLPIRPQNKDSNTSETQLSQSEEK